MAKNVTKEQFDGGIAGLREDIRYLIKLITTQSGEMRQGFTNVNGRIDALQEDMTLVKAAVLETASTDTHLHNLTSELRSQGISIQDTRVFKP